MVKIYSRNTVLVPPEWIEK